MAPKKRARISKAGATATNVDQLSAIHGVCDKFLD
jgi:hypothetical protein